MQHDSLSRRKFVQSCGAVAASLPLLGSASHLWAAPTYDLPAETAAQQLYKTLTDEQKKVIAFGFNHQLRKKHNANWAITKPNIGGKFYTDEQRKLIDTIVRGVTSEDGYQRFQRQMDEDTLEGIGSYHIAFFGEPGSDKFEWEMTGRHLTLRADGNSVAGMAFGGPIIYGHGESDPKDNVFHYQTKQANKVLDALDAKQAKQALVAKSPAESAVPLQGAGGNFPGISVGALSADQKQLVDETIDVLLAPYRKEDIAEAKSIIKAGGGLDALHMAFYTDKDLNNDKVWDNWRVEGPTVAWHFRGAPHVHAYINIGKKG